MQNSLKFQASEAAFAYVESGMTIGLGTGSTTEFFIKILGKKVETGELEGIKAVPTSERTARMALDLGIELVSLADFSLLDLAVDGADEVDEDLNLIKGLGKALLREKIVEIHAKEFIVIVDQSKMVKKLGSTVPLPVELAKFEKYAHVNWLNSLGCQSELWCDQNNDPFITDNGNHIARCWFSEGIIDPYDLAKRLDARPGILEHGLFLDMATKVIVATPEEVFTIEREKSHD